MMLSLALVWAALFAYDDPMLTPATITASTTRAGSDPKLVADGKADTAWLADADGGFAIGQWVRLDFGKEVEITRIEIVNGVQRVEGDKDFFCANARATGFDVYGDATRVTEVGSDDAYKRALVATVGKGLAEPLRTRTLTIVVRNMEQGLFDKAALGISEVKVFGKAVPAPAAEKGDVTCDSRRMGLLRQALIEHCAKTYTAKRPTAECWLARAAIDFCKMEPPEWMPIAAASFDSGKVDLAFKGDSPPFPALTAKFARDASGKWSVTELTCMRGKKACGLRHEIDSDGDRTDLEVSERKVCKTAAGKFMKAP